MKKYIFNLSVLFIAVLFFSGAGEVINAPAAVVTKVVNSAQYKASSGKWADLKVGQALSSEDMVKTPSKSLVVIKFTDNSVLKVRENSQVKISTLKKDKNVSKTVDVDKGSVNASVTKQDQQDFKFKSPTLVASVRGTWLLFGAGGDTTTVDLAEGRLFCEAQLGKQESGDLKENETVAVTAEGSFAPKQMGIEEKKRFNNSSRSNIKKIVLKTPQGDIIIEYLEN
jgi:hypothetical protein